MALAAIGFGSAMMPIESCHVVPPINTVSSSDNMTKPGRPEGPPSTPPRVPPPMTFQSRPSLTRAQCGLAGTSPSTGPTETRKFRSSSSNPCSTASCHHPRFARPMRSGLSKPISWSILPSSGRQAATIQAALAGNINDDHTKSPTTIPAVSSDASIARWSNISIPQFSKWACTWISGRNYGLHPSRRSDRTYSTDAAARTSVMDKHRRCASHHIEDQEAARLAPGRAHALKAYGPARTPVSVEPQHKTSAVRSGSIEGCKFT